jgi:hypothetical protein
MDKAMWQRMTKYLIQDGITPKVSSVAAADATGKIFPSVNMARLGQNRDKNLLLNTLPTSYSFIRQPASMIGKATKGYAKIMSLQKLTPQEKLATKLMTQMAGTILVVAAISAAISAAMAGGDDDDILKAMLRAMNPDPMNGDFASIVIGKHKMPLGGPYRGLFRMIFPQKLSGIPVPIPFAGLPAYLRNRITPLVSTQIDIIQNRDYYGKPILKGDTPGKVLRLIEYESENSIPLTIGSIIEGIRTETTAKETAINAVGQFLGGNVSKVNLIAPLRHEWDKEIIAFQKIPTNAKGVQSRDTFRERNPIVEAHLFVVGQVTTISTGTALNEIVRIAKENKLTVDDIRGARLNMETREKNKKLGIKKERTLTDILVDRLASKQQPATPTAPVVPERVIPTRSVPTTAPVGRTTPERVIPTRR